MPTTVTSPTLPDPDFLTEYTTSGYPYGEQYGCIPVRDSYDPPPIIRAESVPGLKIERNCTIGMTAYDSHGLYLDARKCDCPDDALKVPLAGARVHWQMPTQFVHGQDRRLYIGPNEEFAFAHIVGIYEIPHSYFPLVKFVVPVYKVSGFSGVLSVGIRASLHHDNSGFSKFTEALYAYLYTNTNDTVGAAISNATRYAYRSSPWNF